MSSRRREGEEEQEQEQSAKQEEDRMGGRRKRKGGWERHLIPRMTLLGWVCCVRPGQGRYKVGLRQRRRGRHEANKMKAARLRGRRGYGQVRQRETGTKVAEETRHTTDMKD